MLNVEEGVAMHTVVPQGTNTLLPVMGIVTMTTMTVVIVTMIMVNSQGWDRGEVRRVGYSGGVVTITTTTMMKTTATTRTLTVTNDDDDDNNTDDDDVCPQS